MRQMLRPLHARHDAGATFERFREDDPTGAQREQLARLQPSRTRRAVIRDGRAACS
jgi:hypothetical protein